MLNRKVLLSYAIGVLTIVAGGCVAKWLHAEAGVALFGAGTMWLGKLMAQPAFVRGKGDGA
jgi:hypothetical protein